MAQRGTPEFVSETLRQGFDEARFVELLTDLLVSGDFSEEAAGKRQMGNYIYQPYQEHVASMRRVGKYTYTDRHGVAEMMDLLVVKMKEPWMLERSRGKMRAYIQEWLSRRSSPRNHALVAFHADDSPSWRLSLVKWADVLDAEGKLTGAKSPAKRWSFLVGQGEATHTAARQLVELLDEGNKARKGPSLERVEEAFSVDKVTEDFFRAYKGLYQTLKAHLDAPAAKRTPFGQALTQANLTTEAFAKKLLGQLVFLYFLQKKGWLGVEPGQPMGSGDRKFFRNQFAESQSRGESFYDGFLKLLFYEGLALPPEARSAAFRARIPFNIPFLNGGLFETPQGLDWRGLEAGLPNTLFANTTELRKGELDKGNGILDVFDRTNFTVCEDEPLEREVAVDPEMLGNVFEKLLNEDEREDQGAFYTPREVVHYMCKEALTCYLDHALNGDRQDRKVDPDTLRQWLSNTADQGADTRKQPRAALDPALQTYAAELDAALAEVRAVDPAVGSGAFLMGLMAEIVNARLSLWHLVHPTQAPNPYALKLQAVRRSLFGVDLNPQAVDIARLRLWLSLVVDEDNSSQPTPLPNLDFNVQVGNSLVSRFPLDAPLGASLEGGENSLPTYLANIQAYQTTTDPAKKAALKEAISRFKTRLFEGQMHRDPDRHKLDALKDAYFKEFGRQHLNFGPDAELDKRRQKRETKLKKDIEHLEARLKQREQGAVYQDAFEWRYQFPAVLDAATGDYQGFNLVLANPPYVRQENDTVKGLKAYLKEHYAEVASGTSDLYVYFYALGVRLLDGQGALAYITSNKWLRAGYGKGLRAWLPERLSLRRMVDFRDLPVFQNTIAYPLIVVAEAGRQPGGLKGWTVPDEGRMLHFESDLHQHGKAMDQNLLDPAAWRIEDRSVERLLQKIKAAGTPLGEYVQGRMYYGIKTGCNEAFVVDQATRDRLIAEHPSSAEVLKPYLRGRDIKRYRIEDPGLWLIYIPNGWTNEHRGQEDPTAFFKKHFPAIAQHLVPFIEQLKARSDQGQYWWELRACAYYEEFERPKIVFPDIASRNEFAYEARGSFLGNTAYIIPTERLELLAKLNSSLVLYYYSQISSSIRGGYFRFINTYLVDIPIATNSSIDVILSTLVKQMGSLTKVPAIEAQIDLLVYDLYGLTAEECRVVDPTFPYETEEAYQAAVAQAKAAAVA